MIRPIRRTVFSANIQLFLLKISRYLDSITKLYLPVLLDIEVVTYYDDNKLNEYDVMSPDDRRDISLDGVLKLASICRQVSGITWVIL